MRPSGALGVSRAWRARMTVELRYTGGIMSTTVSPGATVIS
jgi:hypothetical protein